MPGQRNNSPFCVDGAVPGMSVVTALMMFDLVGPRETLPPQESRLIKLVGDGKAEVPDRKSNVDREITAFGYIFLKSSNTSVLWRNQTLQINQDGSNDFPFVWPIAISFRLSIPHLLGSHAWLLSKNNMLLEVSKKVRLSSHSNMFHKVLRCREMTRRTLRVFRSINQLAGLHPPITSRYSQLQEPEN